MNKNYRMAKFININGKYVPYTNNTDLIKLQSEEIQRLKDENVNLSTENMILEGQKNRVEHIIDELEKWLNEAKSGDISFAYKHTLDKLKELKEGK